MNVTTRDLFNYDNYATTYARWLKSNSIEEGELSENHDDYNLVLQAKQQGTLAGEQVQHERSNDLEDCGDV